MRDTDPRAFEHALNRIDLAFDLFRIDVEAAGDHEILGPADDVDVAVAIDAGQIAGDEEAIGVEFLRRLFRHPRVAGEHIGSLALDDPDLASSNRPARLCFADANADPQKREADRPGPPLAVV